MRLVLRAAAVMSLLTLVACGQQPAPQPGGPTTPTAAGVLQNHSAGFIPLGAAFMVIDPDSFIIYGVHEVDAGVFSTALTPVGDDGSFEVPLPTAAELPASTLASADEFIAFAASTCNFTTSSTTARVSKYDGIVGYGSIPGVVVASLDTYTVTHVTATPYDDDDLASRHQPTIAWLYATEDVTISTGDEECLAYGQPLHVDLELEEGWNNIVLRLEWDEDYDTFLTANISNFSGDEMFFNIRQVK